MPTVFFFFYIRMNQRPSGLLAPRAKASVQRVVPLGQAGFDPSSSQGTLTPPLSSTPAPRSVFHLGSDSRVSRRRGWGRVEVGKTEQNPVFLSFVASFLKIISIFSCESVPPRVRM